MSDKKLFKGIDVSAWQGKIDWYKVKLQVDFAMIRCGYGSDIEYQDDKCFVDNINACNQLGIPYGIYLYSYATNTQMAYSEALHVLRLIKNYKPEYPIYIDIEDKCQEHLSPQQLGDIVETFCETLESNGYFVGVYSSKDWFENKLTDPRFELYTKWVAQWNDICTYNGAYGMWQYSNKGHIDGILGNVDMNIAMMDFPLIIKKGFNGWKENNTNKIKVGDKVKVKQNSKSCQGVQLALFVYYTTYEVISVNGNRAVIGINGQVTTDIHIDDLILL